jgi:hypothetical protein
VAGGSSERMYRRNDVMRQIVTNDQMMSNGHIPNRKL